MRHELESIVLVHSNTDVWKVFVNSAYDRYFERVQAFDETVKGGFPLNWEEDNSRVRGLNIPIPDEAILAISGLPQEGKKWFSWKDPLSEFPKVFLQARETKIQK